MQLMTGIVLKSMFFHSQICFYIPCTGECNPVSLDKRSHVVRGATEVDSVEYNNTKRRIPADSLRCTYCILLSSYVVKSKDSFSAM